ncbi:MAG: hypothetical protein OXE96_16150 [Gemmatimonadetes bacterium]|nr:hypothetical protein [Gemmatimonadota bacterium]
MTQYRSGGEQALLEAARRRSAERQQAKTLDSETRTAILLDQLVGLVEEQTQLQRAILHELAEQNHVFRAIANTAVKSHDHASAHQIIDVGPA